MFYALEIQLQKTDIGVTCFFHQKTDAGKPMLGQHVIFIRNPTLENQRWKRVFFHWKYGTRKVTSGQRIFFIVNPTSQKSP